MYVSKNHRQKLLQCQKRIFNIIAYKMAEVLHDHCKTELTDLLNRYEAEPTPEHEARDADASALPDKCPLYKELAYIPYSMMTGEKEFYLTFWDSDILYEIGFIDVPKECTDCKLLFDTDKKIFDLLYVYSYESPDDYGFGAEWHYDDIYFNEFFRRLPRYKSTSAPI